MDRRQFLLAGAVGGGLALLGGLSFASAQESPVRFGELLPPDANGVRLPADFSSRVVAVTGEPVAATGYRWHPNPDGGATFAQPDGGWVYVSNDEASGGRGGVSMLRFDADGAIVDARSICSGTTRNCAGGAMPWGTWLSCEEFDEGRVWECDPLGERPAIVRPAMGVFNHEAAAADPVRKVIYLTEDKGDGALYRFVPDTWRDLSSGTLQVMIESGSGLGWETVPDPQASDEVTRRQLPSTKRFEGGEGAWYEDDSLYFTTKGDNRVWRYRADRNELEIIYDIETSPNPVLSGVDNVTMSPSGDLYVCEDGGNMEVVIVTPDGGVEPFCRIPVEGSELTGVAFDPSGTRMYVSSQREPGMTFEITGPFMGNTATTDEAGAEPLAAPAPSSRRSLTTGATDPHR